MVVLFGVRGGARRAATKTPKENKAKRHRDAELNHAQRQASTTALIKKDSVNTINTCTVGVLCCRVALCCGFQPPIGKQNHY